MDKVFSLESASQLQEIFGIHDGNIKEIEKRFSVKVLTRGGKLKLRGDSNNIKKAMAAISSLLESENKANDRHQSVTQNQLYKDKIVPKTKGQKDYVEIISKYDIVFAVGPAGTGKTYLAVWQAKEALRRGEVKRIILTRPAIEAGESLGFLPGDIYAKISPYLRPLYDALYDMMDARLIEKYTESGIIEVAPLAFMRGRTLNDAFVILDEAQNCTAEQMKMFLTRLGFDSKAVITGDLTQSDLPGAEPVGLLQAQELLKDIEDIKFTHLNNSDIVRHELVQKIIKAYENANHKR